MRYLTRLFYLLLAGIFILGVSGLGITLYLGSTLPPIERLDTREVTESTKLFDRSGKTLLYEIYNEERRSIIPFSEIPDVVRDATIAVEDANFYTHPAVDIRGILRAVAVNILRGSRSQGGSTITQQLAKNAFLTREKLFTRKIKELILAYRIEQRYSKDEILSLYLNQIPYGSNSYGIEAASRTFFGKSTRDLSLAEASLLVALPQSPSYYSPWGSHTSELEERRRFVLKRMHDLLLIDEEQYLAARDTPPRIMLEPRRASFSLAPHFISYVRERLAATYGEEFVARGGLRVITTLDTTLQALANSAVSEGAALNTELYEGHNAALIAEDPRSGEILALVGSKDYFAESEPAGCVGSECRFESKFNVPFQGLRQPGSSFKPIAYAAAFLTGLTPDTVVLDTPTEFSTLDSCPAIVDFLSTDTNCYHPQNYDKIFRGPITLKESLAQSINIPAVKVIYLAGLEETISLAERMGITTLSDRSRLGLSVVLGGGEVRLAELARAYSVFATGGTRTTQTTILRVEDSSGRVLESYTPSPERVLDKNVADTITDILANRRLREPLFQSSIRLTSIPGHEVALKTGTTNNYVDAWTIGYTPHLVVGVWVGNNNAEPLKQYGGSILASVPIWHSFMSAALRDLPATPLTPPTPTPASLPILRGELPLTGFHTILHYLNRLRDDQYVNWEAGLSSWLSQNPEFSYTPPVNLPSYTFDPELSGSPTRSGSSSGLSIRFSSPEHGSFVSGREFSILASIQAETPITSIELFLNGTSIHRVDGSFGSSYSYTHSLPTSSLTPQNTLKLRTRTSGGEVGEGSLILYRR